MSQNTESEILFRKRSPFISALQRIDATGGPSPGSHNSYRGEPLAMRDTRTRDAIATLRGALDADAVTAFVAVSGRKG
jgi:aminoglycoside phosphotransferase (APT) family kinase protein